MPTRRQSIFELLSRASLKQLADPASFERGEDYYRRERVRDYVYDGEIVRAKVWGTDEYRVKLWAEDGDIRYDCTCPVGDRGDFCKHCVAVGLEVIEDHEPGTSATPKKPAVTMDDVRAYLKDQNKDALVEMIVRLAKEDDRLYDQLRMKAARHMATGLDLSAFRSAIDNAVHSGDFVDWRSVYAYTQGIHDVIGSVEELLQEGHASEVIDLCEYALAKVEDAMGYVDDSDGDMGMVLGQLQEVHLAACEQARPDPEVLARRLFEWELRSDWDTFYGAAEIYADVLGEKGLAVYRELVDAEWARVPALAPGQDDPEKYGRRYRITSIMESLAAVSGDVEALVAVKSRDLSNAYAFLEIAQIYKNAGLHDKALEWAEEGVRQFPERTDSRLRAFLAEEYHSRERHDEAMALAWAEFTDHPCLDRYRLLKEHADRIGQWSGWRDKALLHMRHTLRKARQQSWGGWWAGPPDDHSELVRIFLWEGDDESAWEEAQSGGCSSSLWMDLASKREKTHPEDALGVYRKFIEPTIQQKNNQSYEEAVGLLRKIKRLMSATGQASEFPGYLASIRTAHKPKRNLMKLLDQAKLD